MTGKKRSPERNVPGAAKLRARSGRYGDLRLLAISVGILLLCVIGLILQKKSVEPGSGSAPLDTSSATMNLPSGPVSDRDSLEETDPNGVYQSGASQGEASPNQAPTQASPPKQEEILRDMAERIPPGQTIVF